MLEHSHVHVCRHSVTVVASMRYPLHRRQVMWAFMSQSLIFLVNIFGFCKRTIHVSEHLKRLWCFPPEGQRRGE